MATPIIVKHNRPAEIIVGKGESAGSPIFVPSTGGGGTGGVKLEELRKKYSARFERNDDGDSTFSVVMPIVKGVEEQVGEVKAKETEEYKLMKKTFSARFVKNNDGDNTYSMILPVVSEIMKNEDGTVTIKL